MPSDLEQIRLRFASTVWIPDSGFNIRQGKQAFIGWTEQGDDKVDETFRVHLNLHGNYPG